MQGILLGSHQDGRAGEAREPVQGDLEATEASRRGPNLPLPFPAGGCLLRATLAGSVVTKTRDLWMPEKES